MDRETIEEILEQEGDVERAKARIDGLLAAERLTLERERSERDEERLDREKRRWYANPLFVAVSVGALTLVGDFFASTYQSARDLTLQRERAASELIRSAFVDDPEQTIRNLEFMIAADLIDDESRSIIQAARDFEPRETVPRPSPTRTVTPGRFDPPLSFVGTVERVLDGDSVTLKIDWDFSTGPVPRLMPQFPSSRLVSASLAGVDAAEMRIPGCDPAAQSDAIRWGENARDFTRNFAEPGQSKNVRIMLTEVDRIGQLHAIIAPLTRATEDPRAIFDASLNASLLDAGLAVPAVEDQLPSLVWSDVRRRSAMAERSRRGLFSSAGRRIDVSEATFASATPWLMRRACSIKRRGKEPMEYFRDFFSSQTVLRRAEDGRVLDLEDFIRVEGDVIEQLIPMHELEMQFLTR